MGYKERRDFMIEIIPPKNKPHDISRMVNIIIYMAITLAIIAGMAYCIIGFWVFNNVNKLIEYLTA